LVQQNWTGTGELVSLFIVTNVEKSIIKAQRTAIRSLQINYGTNAAAFHEQ